MIWLWRLAYPFLSVTVAAKLNPDITPDPPFMDLIG